MQNTKILLLFISSTLIFISYKLYDKNLGQIWSQLHVNSLIGFQKGVNILLENINIAPEIVNNLIIILLNTPILFLLAIAFIAFYLYLLKR